jgi:hypothetical protein
MLTLLSLATRRTPPAVSQAQAPRERPTTRSAEGGTARLPRSEGRSPSPPRRDIRTTSGQGPGFPDWPDHPGTWMPDSFAWHVEPSPGSRFREDDDSLARCDQIECRPMNDLLAHHRGRPSLETRLNETGGTAAAGVGDVNDRLACWSQC